VTFQAVTFRHRVDIVHTVVVPAEEAAPANAIQDRAGEYILDRAGNYIQTR
jgi:hypothetical protein